MIFSRKKFLKNSRNIGLGLTLGGLSEILSERSSREEKIIVIGAGASGLYAARLLRDKGFPVTILEASSIFGGRIKPLLTFSDYPIELGAEEIHGEKSLYSKLLKSNNVSIFNSSISENYYMCNGKLKDEAEADAGLLRRHYSHSRCIDYLEHRSDRKNKKTSEIWLLINHGIQSTQEEDC
jgi:monoamine oxidase